MKFLVLLMIGLLDATYASRCIGECNILSDDLLAHEECDKYCECTLLGDAIEYSCEHGLHFSFELQDCVHPLLVNCGDVSEPSIPTSPPTIPPSTSLPVTPSPPVDNNGCIGKCPLINLPDYTIHLAHKECKKFCKCNWGQPIVKNCPENLHFNNESKTCDYIFTANCTGIGHIENLFK
ncbi:uncharacterized protein LOC123261837 [Cotesia glomerata]|uniref:Chitin-binding type-2 domain-containing protein n=1 Tax=Cotesia glomerata TaxID=32391 RepID=A0AAV7IAN7_COTGL|nr:uncharacterized protein LOC123261837 [Cotesia glomerata]KAH0548713.1 hypothetical protein KQX54_001626 [Cotesia glomerata]